MENTEFYLIFILDGAADSYVMHIQVRKWDVDGVFVASMKGMGCWELIVIEFGFYNGPRITQCEVKDIDTGKKARPYVEMKKSSFAVNVVSPASLSKSS